MNACISPKKLKHNSLSFSNIFPIWMVFDNKIMYTWICLLKSIRIHSPCILVLLLSPHREGIFRTLLSTIYHHAIIKLCILVIVTKVLSLICPHYIYILASIISLFFPQSQISKLNILHIYINWWVHLFLKILVRSGFVRLSLKSSSLL